MRGLAVGLEHGMVSAGLPFAQVPDVPRPLQVADSTGLGPTETIPEVSDYRLGAALGTACDPSLTSGCC